MSAPYLRAFRQPLTIEKNAFDEIEVEQNADNEIWRTIYDVDGQLKTRIDPDGNAGAFHD